MNLRTYGIGLCVFLIMVMTGCNLPTNANTDNITLTAVADSGSQPTTIEATAEVTAEATHELDTLDSGSSTNDSIIGEQTSLNTTTTTVITKTTTTNSTTSTNPSCTPRSDWFTYAVQSGDTLGQIATRVGSSVSELTQANCLSNANVLYTGQQLYVPKQPTSNLQTNINNRNSTNNTTVNPSCRIHVNTRTEVVDLPQGTSANILGYLPAGSVVEPTMRLNGLPYYAFNFNGQTGWIDAQPNGDCSHLPDHVDRPPQNPCQIFINTRTEIVNAPQGTGRTVLGYLEAGEVVQPQVHFEGLPYYGFWYGESLGWIEGTPSGDCSKLRNGGEVDPSPAQCTVKTAHSIQGYALPDASSTVVHTLQAGVSYDVVGKRPQSWYKVKFPDVGMEGWVQVEASGNCANLPGQVYECQFVGDTRVPIYRNPEIGSDQLDTLEAGDVYRFAMFEGEWVSGDVRGYWIKVFYQNHRPLAGYIQNTGGHLEGNCPTR